MLSHSRLRCVVSQYRRSLPPVATMLTACSTPTHRKCCRESCKFRGSGECGGGGGGISLCTFEASCYVCWVELGVEKTRTVMMVWCLCVCLLVYMCRQKCMSLSNVTLCLFIPPSTMVAYSLTISSLFLTLARLALVTVRAAAT